MLQSIDAAEQAGASIVDRVTDAFAESQAPSHPPPVSPSRFLRPPGALPAEAFADTCSRCGDCVRACPAQCIVLDETVAGGLPHIVARKSPCVVCDDLSCMKGCPTGALQLVGDVSYIDMGMAVMNFERCLRSESHGRLREDCTVCIDQCPIEEVAIGLDDAGRVEVRDGCIGCGVCERVCPTQPASITVEPRDN